MLAGCGCHLILAGHLHHGYTGDVRGHHVEVKRSMLVIQAGTAISHRRRDEANAYNLITAGHETMTLEVRRWTGQQFAPAAVTNYAYQNDAWTERPA